MSQPTTLPLPQHLGLRQITDLQQALLSALAEHDDVELSVPVDAETDLSFIQLILSFRRHADAHGKHITLAAPATGQLLVTLERSGVLTGAASQDLNFWLHRKEDA